ncbi:bacillithiol biosynthesis cysteine-adding enzyme BshC [Fictibacillus iocasae]|uniref:Putative cysteine ligase BshC n=1 Tax=Fictibacillus iocasae TaxID=2715437 RepID=A0ABW2NVL7_9BACL
MKIQELNIPEKQHFTAAYLADDPIATSFFDYDYKSRDTLKNRMDELHALTYPREPLASYFERFNKRFFYTEHTARSIEKIKHPKGLAVVGGQQAGFMTGPLLALYKAISVILYAKKAEDELGIPVAPVFWIAGEDHDLDEINHVFVREGGVLKKKPLKQTGLSQSPASHFKLNHQEVDALIDSVIRSFGETPYTKDLLLSLKHDANKSRTFVEFFAHCMGRLFGEEGLLLLDSGDHDFKKMQSSFTAVLTEENERIHEAFASGIHELECSGFPAPIDVQDGSTHLFYYDKDKRSLLYRDKEGMIKSKDGELSFSVEKLKELAEHEPEKLSNNVVTRPLMQEWMLPVLSFIAGPGEIAYWAALKNVFHIFGRKLPPVVPRLSFTIAGQKEMDDLTGLGITPESLIASGLSKERAKVVSSQKPDYYEDVLQAATAQILEGHEAIRKMAVSINPDLEHVSLYNQERILREIAYLQRKMEHRLRKKVKSPLSILQNLELQLKPDGVLQERVFSPYEMINRYGPDFPRKLLSETLEFNGKHKWIWMHST